MSGRDSENRGAGAALYHVADAADWRRAREAGVYAGGAADRADGFVHFSTADQLAGTLAHFFRGRRGLVLLVADAAQLGPALRWDPVPGGGVFPHYHGTLATAALAEIGPLAPGPDGVPRPPRGVRAR